jgi:Fic family protein
MRMPEKAPSLSEALGKLDPARMPAVFGTVLPDAARSARYLHWDELRWRKPPGDVTQYEWWTGLKVGRSPLSKSVFLPDRSGASFTYCVPDLAQRRLHFIDQNLSGQITLSEVVTNPSTRDRYIVNSLIEEAITSSQLEGAATSRTVAKDMIRSGRLPRDKSEQMILNNFMAMQRVGELRNEPLTPNLVLELHAIVTRDTLSSTEAEGRLQRPGEERVRVWSQGVNPQILHSPPPAEELPSRLESMCAFANGLSDDGFVHPVVRAIVLHFWLAYDHPFEDGNGRTARVLFYWAMLAQKYWLAEFVAISRILRQAPAQYTRSFLLTETDENDLTYFLLYQLTVIERAIRDLHTYLGKKMAEIHEAEMFIRQSTLVNHRQLALLTHAMRHPDHTYTIESHKRSHRVAYETARSDLLSLVDAEYLVKVRLGRAFGFVPDPQLSERLAPRR